MSFVGSLQEVSFKKMCDASNLITYSFDEIQIAYCKFQETISTMRNFNKN